MRKRRRQLILVSALLVLFVGALAVWVGNPNDGHEKPEVQAGYTPPATPSDTVPAIISTPTPTVSATSSGATTGTVTGVKLPPVSGVQVYGAGTHTVTITVTANSTLSAVGYAFRNGKNGKKTAGSAGKSFSLTEQVEGGSPLAIVGGQVSFYGTQATCTITVDGTKRITKTVQGAYHVVVCLA
jgi:hypothetical protein